MGILGALGILITVLSASLIINTLNALLTQTAAPDRRDEAGGWAQHPNTGHVFNLNLCLCIDRPARVCTAGTLAGNELARYVSSLMAPG